METRRLGKTDMMVTALGFGGAEIGFQSAPQETVTTLLNAALDAGLNVIDTAECYGASEEMIGNAVGHRRSEFILFSKCGHASGIDLPDWDPAMLALSIDRSLKRLKTDHLDLIQLHTCSEETLRQGDVIQVVQKARDAGKAKYIGYSGDSKAALYARYVRRIRYAADLGEHCGPGVYRGHASGGSVEPGWRYRKAADRQRHLAIRF